MGVQIFRTAMDYKNWVDYTAARSVVIISVNVFQDEIIVTYAQ